MRSREHLGVQRPINPYRTQCLSVGSPERQVEPPSICTCHPSQSLASILLISYDDNRGLSIGMSHKASVVKHLISSSLLLKCNLHSPAASPRLMQFPLSGMPPSHLTTNYCSSSQTQVLTSAKSPTIHPPPHVGRDIFHL